MPQRPDDDRVCSSQIAYNVQVGWFGRSDRLPLVSKKVDRLVTKQVNTAGPSTAPTILSHEKPRRLGVVVEELTDSADLSALGSWPPDVFAVTGEVLTDSGAFRQVVSPPPGERWPPGGLAATEWDAKVRKIAREWGKTANIEGDGSAPKEVENWLGVVQAAADVSVNPADTTPGVLSDWDLVSALISLHVVADEALAGLGGGVDTPNFDNPCLFPAKLHLAEYGTIASLPADRVRVLPKLRTPTGGMTVRSLSRHMALVSPDVNSMWFAVPRRQPTSLVQRRFNVLVVPWPEEIVPKDFKVYDGDNLLNMDASKYGFFSYDLDRRIDPKKVVDLVVSAIERTGASVDAVVLPESALRFEEVKLLQAALLKGEGTTGVPAKDIYKSPAFLFTGVRGEGAAGEFGENLVMLGIAGVDDWEMVKQHKHHRWCLDSSQIQQYHLGAALHPARQWWEAIALHERERVFVDVNEWLTLCPVICEDLARLDPAGDSVHAVGPTLVVALLLDGPQLDSRWSARYATVLADDPGSSVLSVTSLGMALRSRPAEVKEISRTVALWKDRKRGVREIALDEKSDAVLLTLCVEERPSVTADGRSHDAKTFELVLAGIEQLSCSGLAQ